ncbi:prolyl oligopeptidase family serine peptidase [Bifidobacterium amazonense]|uniref:Prolyl oligopeptidase family serine peptidase n=1 Tax=Bifidobacterium amazonense TaxID=2809027 RepID=A0ABS9VY93_9BIFI|nr:prolyl oligopeptidase family serine peptidase [Bifidobacterium amazonense]MCH9277033.1 prolyl oligopeptidase family serine peptidase [Bifidobacterium amazonense]
MTNINDNIVQFPRLRARTLRFGCGAPRSARVIGDGSRALFLRSDGPEDLVTALWLSVIGKDAAGKETHREILLADPRALLADADSEDVPAEEKARRERAREGGSGIVSYSVDAAGRRVVFTINGRLFLTEIVDGEPGESGASPAGRTRQLAAAQLDTDEQGVYGPVLNPRISPDGRHVLYTTGEHLVLIDIAADPAGDRIGTIWGVDDETDDADGENTWKIGLAEFVAGEEMDRYDGFWWGPDSRHILFETFDTAREPIWYISDPANPERPAVGRRYPRALTENAETYLTVAELAFDADGTYAGIDGAPVEWDRATYEYIAAVSWAKDRDPLVLVQDRCQRNDQVLSVTVDGDDAGATRVLETHHNDQWIDLIPGTPAYTPDGRFIGALNDMDEDTNRLTVNGRAFTPAGWQVRGVLDVTDRDVLALVQRSPETAPDVPDEWAAAAADERRLGDHDARSFDVASIAYDGTITPVTDAPGSWTASRGEGGIVVSGRDMAHARSTMLHNGHAIANHAAEPGFTPNLTFTRLGEHRLYTAIIAPSADSPYAQAEKLPVLMKPYGGPGFQQVIASQAFYWEAQWWADQGFLVVTADGRGTTGRGPKWDRAIFENMKDVTLADQVEAVHALPDAVAALNAAAAADGDAMRIPAPDLDKVCMIGWSYGGFLSALAVLDAPDVFKAGCAGAPPTDWTLYDTHYTERYLGLDPEVYERNGIVQDAPKLERALMLIHGFADDNVTIAHSLRLSQALMAAGRPHTYLPLTGITHMTNDETVAENLLILQRDFLRDALA